MPEPGTLIEGKYEILGKIREGGMGAIYKVRHTLLDEIRVVKVLRPEMVADPELRRRFVEEAKTATRLKHPNIGTIHDFALDEDGTAYLVMEFIDGVSLIDLTIAHGLPSLALVLEIAHQALLALGYLHRKSVVHRDIAPDNLMLTQDEEGQPQIKLIDLGIAKAIDREQNMTSTGVFLGKLKYASPELFGSLPPGEKLDGRSDLYSLGVVLYELLTGVRPIAGDTPAELLRRHLFEPPTPFEATDPRGRVPPELRAILLKALQKKREERFATAEEFDREILALRRRFAAPEDLQGTAAMVSRVRQTGEHMAVTITPSAQDRLNLRFGVQATPHPPPLGMDPATQPTQMKRPTADPEAARAGEAPPSPARTAPAETTRSRRALPIGVGAAVIVGAIVASALLLGRREESQKTSGSETMSPEPTAAAPAAEPTVALPTAAPAVLATAAPEPTAASPTARPTSPEAAVAFREAEQTRVRAARSRSAAEKARAPELAAGAYERATAKEREARTLFERRSFAAAQAAWELAAQLFETAQMSAEGARREKIKPSPVAVAAVSPLIARPESTRAPIPTAAGETAKPAAAAAAEPARAAPTEQERIRETIERYEKAQSTLDADLYARVYPGVDRARIRAAFSELRAQNVEFSIQKIDIETGGTSAVVTGYETRVATPRVGSEQRYSGKRVLHLEKRGDTWVIVALGT